MVKGVSVKLKSYEETIPKLLEVIKFDQELKKHDKIVLKPNLANGNKENSTNPKFVEQVLKYCMENKNPGAEVFIAEGCDGVDTIDTFDSLGFRTLAEKYRIGFIDLNKADSKKIEDGKFFRFDEVMYPKILLDSFVISLSPLREDREIGISASLHNMVGAYPGKHYKGIFSKSKVKVNKFPLKDQIHDIVQCKMPEFALIDASEKSLILAGQPLEMDKQAARALGKDWKNIAHLNMISENLSGIKESDEDKEINDLIGES